MSEKNLPVGFFDSGLGGVSVLAEAAFLLPNESFIYLGDSAHNPYGTKDVADVKRLSLQAADFLIEKGIKALVVACNTATSVAINDLRQAQEIPVIGMEPALKPAVEKSEPGDIIVMATPITLREKKFQCLLSQYRLKRNIVLLPCPGLAELIEKGTYTGPPIQEYLINIFDQIKTENISTVVLGCTHYIFIKRELEKFMPHVRLIDGNRGTVVNLRRILDQQGLLADQSRKDRNIEFFSSADPDRFLPLYRQLFNYYFGK
ncbi:MAG: glutamate racemase [Dehalobacterium sp.]